MIGLVANQASNKRTNQTPEEGYQQNQLKQLEQNKIPHPPKGMES